MDESPTETTERLEAERAYEDRAIRASLERENDFYDKLHFRPEWHAESKRLRENAHAV